MNSLAPIPLSYFDFALLLETALIPPVYQILTKINSPKILHSFTPSKKHLLALLPLPV
jgi:hypothetical protein